jgi:3',5'-cyclic AMP phosphodiesterase CpdA
MRTLVHLSDLHFGRVDMAVIPVLAETVCRLHPDLVVVSGDLTMRARNSEFASARAFMNALPRPQIVVPGNHDVRPFYAPWARWRSPLRRFYEAIPDAAEPSYADEELGVIGLNSARSATVKGGRVNQLQVSRVCEWFDRLPSDAIRAVVTHHPFDLPPAHNPRHLVGRAAMAMAALAGCGVDLFLSGHLHLSYAAPTSERYSTEGHSALIIHAGTATSLRARGEVNSWNLLRIARPWMDLHRYSWNEQYGKFLVSLEQRFQHTADGWRSMETSPSEVKPRLGQSR